ncbi:hypothetical protein SB748_34725, partial [Rhizobium sp. SIMBA_035]
IDNQSKFRGLHHTQPHLSFAFDVGERIARSQQTGHQATTAEAGVREVPALTGGIERPPQ